MWILTGLVVFEEVQFYSKLELYGIAGSITLCCIGIKFLTMKTKMLNAVRRDEKLLAKKTFSNLEHREDSCATNYMPPD